MDGWGVKDMANDLTEFPTPIVSLPLSLLFLNIQPSHTTGPLKLADFTPVPRLPVELHAGQAIDFVLEAFDWNAGSPTPLSQNSTVTLC